VYYVVDRDLHWPTYLIIINMMSIMQQMASLLRAQRIELGMTSKEVASLAGVALGTYGALEAGKRSDASIQTCCRICAAVGLELGIGLRGQMPPPAIPSTSRRRVRR
jgi:DNA-binding XRE family transcriptional regulator